MGSVDAYFDLDDVVQGAEWVQESLPEDLDTKLEMLGSLERALSPSAIVASSSSSCTPTDLSKSFSFADRFIVAHPLHPVYAVPVVELCGGDRTNPRTVERAVEVMRAVGHQPIVLQGEVAGLVTNRLTAALLREAFDLVTRGIISADDLDILVSRGIALGWTAAGPLATEAIGAGSGGFPEFLNRFESALAGIWGSLAGWTSLDGERRATLKLATNRVLHPSNVPQAAVRMEERLRINDWSGRITDILRAANPADGS